MALQAEISGSVKEGIHLRHAVQTGQGLKDQRTFVKYRQNNTDVLVPVHFHVSAVLCYYCKYLDGLCNVETLLHARDVKLQNTQVFTLDGNGP